MRRKSLKTKIPALLLSALMVLSLGVPVSAEEVESTEKTEIESTVTNSGLLIDTVGSKGDTSLATKEELAEVNVAEVGKITLRLTDGAEGTSKQGVEFSCLKVADIKHGEYVIADEYKDLGIDLNDIKNAQELEGSATKLAENSGNGKVATTDKNGKLSFLDLEVGVYLLKATNTENYDNVTPFLISIPTFDHSKKEMAYEIKVTPKHDPKPVPEPEPIPAPQTGVDSMIALYLGLSAAALILLIVVNVAFDVKDKHRKERN